MEYKQVKYIMEENAQLKAEIERLRAENQKLIDNCFYLQGQYELATTGEIAKPEPPQESLKGRVLKVLAKSETKVMYSAIYEEVQEACLSALSDLRREGFVDWGNGFSITAAGRDYLASLDKPTIEQSVIDEMAGRKVRVLRYMEEQTLVRPSIYALQRLFGNDVKETMIELRNDGLVWEYLSKHNTYREYVLTPQGMDYLANNEPETLQRATDVFVECPQCHQQTLNLVHEFCSECDYIKAE